VLVLAVIVGLGAARAAFFVLVLGLVAGVAITLTRNALDISVKSAEVLREVSAAPNLGLIAFDAQVPRRPLTVHGDPQSPRAEAFRRLRTNLHYLAILVRGSLLQAMAGIVVLVGLFWVASSRYPTLRKE
jgi:hypothetical protein